MEALIARPSLHAQIVGTLREMIVENQLAPGARVDEKELSKAFGISRTPLREALKVLASEGLIELLPNRSPRVTRLTRESVGEVFQVISWLDRHAGELAGERVTDKDLAALKRIHKRMMRHYKAAERLEYFRLNRELHFSIITIAGNSVLAGIYSNLMAQTQRARYMAIQSQNHWDRGVKEHGEILEALAAHDGKRLGLLLERHVRETGRRVQMSFEPVEG